MASVSQGSVVGTSALGSYTGPDEFSLTISGLNGLRHREKVTGDTEYWRKQFDLVLLLPKAPSWGM